MATPAEIIERYPQFAAFISHPDLGPLLIRAAEEGMTEIELQGELHKTTWWQTTWADKRQLEVLKATDPAEYKHRQEQTRWEVRTLLSQLGVRDPNNEISNWWAEAWMQNGKDDQSLVRGLEHLLSTKRGDLITDDGLLGARAQEFRQMAAEQAVTFDDWTMYKWALREWSRADSAEAIQERIRQRAAETYTHLAAEIQAGASVRSLASPLVNTIAKTLEIAPEEIDLTDPKYQQLVNLRDDKGPRMMTALEAEHYARQDERFQYTRGARDEAFTLAEGVLRTMGAIA